jgi:hypothetical protein
MEKSEEYKYCPSLYYGIHYDITLLEHVKLACLSNRKFADLGGDSREIDDKKNLFFRSTNSDKDNCATRGFIAVDELTMEGEYFSNPEEVFLQFEPSECIKKEKKHINAVHFIIELYDLIIVYLKKNKIQFDGKIYLGWCLTSCTWDEKSEDDEEDPPLQASASNLPVKKTK